MSPIKPLKSGQRVIVRPSPQDNELCRHLDVVGELGVVSGGYRSIPGSPGMHRWEILFPHRLSSPPMLLRRDSLRLQRADQPYLPWACSERGADMGRRACWPEDDSKWRCARLRFSDGCYDEGGAYWGAPANVYCAWQPDGTGFLTVRAASRAEAKTKFETENNKITFLWIR